MDFQKRYLFGVVFIFLIGVFLRFYNLDWGAPYFFHPDERNVASSISQLSFPNQMNPHFFAYGSLPIYCVFLTGIFINFLQSTIQKTPFLNQVNFEQAIMISRFYSAVLSVLLIPLLYVIGKKLFDIRSGILASLLGVFNVGLIQFAHFGTFEMWLTFFTLLLFWVCIRFGKDEIIRLLIFSSIISGVLVAIKVSSIVLVVLPLISISYIVFIKNSRLAISARSILLFLSLMLSFLVLIGTIYFLTNSYVLIDFSSFKNSIDYESKVGLGMLPVFYTGEFVKTIPIIFQLKHVLPFLLNPIIAICFVPLLIFFSLFATKKRNFGLIILLAFFLITFLSQAFLYVKWIRYIVPSIPFVILIVSISLVELLKKHNVLKSGLYVIIISLAAIFSISFFITTYIEKDTRIQAVDFAKQIIPSNKMLLSEVYDLGIIPFNETYPNISLFNFYDLDSDSEEYNLATLSQALESSDYIILPSQRIFKVRLTKSKYFSNSSKFYKDLFREELGFKKVYETPCSFFCNVAYQGNPIYAYEQTSNVFDRPVVIIFEKVR